MIKIHDIYIHIYRAIAEKTSGNMELARILFKQGLKKCPMHAALWQVKT
jgi:hypothetical protein